MPRREPEFDLSQYAEALGDPSAYFVDHRGRDKPLVVRHEDGMPAFVIEDDDTLTPYEAPAPDPSAAPVSGNLDYRAGDAAFGVGVG